MERSGYTQLLHASSSYSDAKVEAVSQPVKMLNLDILQLQNTGSTEDMGHDEFHCCMTEHVPQGKGPHQLGHS